jgi:hypothetical protein
MLVCVIPGRDCMIVVVHVVMVDGEHHCAKREDRAESGNEFHDTGAA